MYVWGRGGRQRPSNTGIKLDPDHKLSFNLHIQTNHGLRIGLKQAQGGNQEADFLHFLKDRFDLETVLIHMRLNLLPPVALLVYLVHL